MTPEPGLPAPPGFDLTDVLKRRPRLLDLADDPLARPAPRGDHLLNPEMADAIVNRPLKDAAVLVPLMARDGPLSALLTLRASHLAAHAGQVAFPGGKIDPEDAGPVAAALREAEEEIDLSPSRVEPIGYGMPYVTGSGYRIVPVVALVDPAANTRANPAEVEAVFEVPFAFLMRPENHQRVSRPLRGARRHYYRMPYGDHPIWGVTAGIVRGLYEQLYG